MERVRLTADKEVPDARLYRLPLDRFHYKVSAVLEDNAIIPEDPTTARNLKKLLIANQVLGNVIVATFNDTYEQRVGILTVNPDDTVVLKEVIPDNLLEVNEEVMKVNKAEISPQEVEEAKAFLALIPEATDSTFQVHDYRTKGIAEETVSPKVLELDAIIKASKGRVEGLTA